MVAAAPPRQNSNNARLDPAFGDWMAVLGSELSAGAAAATATAAKGGDDFWMSDLFETGVPGIGSLGPSKKVALAPAGSDMKASATEVTCS